MKLKGKTAVVTGSGRGIGREVALSLAREGANVVVVSRNQKEIESVAKEIKALKVKALCVKTDVSSFKDVNLLVEKTMKEFGRIDILVNNAGIFESSLLSQMTEEQWDRMISVDLKGVFNCTRAVINHMIKQKYGKIVNISSIAGTALGFPGSTHYSSSKAGIIGFTQSLAMEVAQHGINVNSIAPGVIKTSMVMNALSEKELEVFSKHIPVGRIGKPEDIANTALFLASDDSAYITGQTITVDGGLVIKM